MASGAPSSGSSGDRWHEGEGPHIFCPTCGRLIGDDVLPAGVKPARRASDVYGVTLNLHERTILALVVIVVNAIAVVLERTI